MASIVKQYTKHGEEHGLINEFTNSNAFDDFKHMEGKYKEKCIKEKKEDARKVKVKYINTKGRVERLQKIYCRWSGDPLQQWKFIPGYVYEVPMGLVNEINEIKNYQRSGLCTVDGTDLNPLGSPIEEDQRIDSEHLLVPATF